MSILPLHCSVCPKRPNFSDVSHLLTHIASKGHLSHYYKLKVRAVQDRNAKHTLDVYDNWYNQYNVEDLMAARLNDKEKKRPRGRTHDTLPRPAKPPVPATEPPTLLDPRLDASLYNFPLDEDLVQPEQAPDSFAALQGPQLHLWSTDRPASYQAAPLHWPPSPSPQSAFEPDQSTADDTTESVSTDPHVLEEAAKLKGIFWPGMDLFDSATTEMKRKRNQKKDVSVLEQLEQNSLDVQPTEVIYHPFGAFHKQRPITGKPESSSPHLEDSASPPARKTSSRRILADRNINGGTLPARPARYSRQRPGARAADARRSRSEFSVFNDGDPSREPFTSSIGAMRLLQSSFSPSPESQTPDAPPPDIDSFAIQQAPQASMRGSGTEIVTCLAPESTVSRDYYGPTGFDLQAFMVHHSKQPQHNRRDPFGQPPELIDPSFRTPDPSAPLKSDSRPLEEELGVLVADGAPFFTSSDCEQ